MQNLCWHARFLALPPPLRRLVAEIVCAPATQVSSSTSSSSSFSSFTARRPRHTAYTPHVGCRAFSISCRRGAMAQKTAALPKRPGKPKTTTTKTTKTAAAKSRKPPPSSRPPALRSTPPPTKARSSKKPPRAPPSPTQTDHIRALSFLPPPPSGAPLTTDGEAAAVAAVAATVRLAPMPTTAALDRASALFVRPPPQFLYSAPRFLNLPVNTRMPEVCILGRSNVGKSTLLNALAGLESGGKAGHSHGARTGRLGLAITSARAGCTKMMNGYGFGPPLRAALTQVFDRVKEMEEEKEKKQAIVPSSSGVVSRSQKRAQKPGEPSPAHSFVLVDMPGYGFMSRSAWGTEITKYLERRATLRGAVLLVDAVTGIKDDDRQALAMLRDANIRTVVVLTKADKLLPAKLLHMPPAVAAAKRNEKAAAIPGSGGGAPLPLSPEPAFQTGDSEGEQALRESCLRVWKVLRTVERASFGTVPWMEGQGWAPEICVTGAGDPRGGGFGVAGARLAICRMAGLVPQTTSAAASAPSPKKQKKESKSARSDTDAAATVSRPVVPFDQIQWAETATDAVIDQSEELHFISLQEVARQGRKARPQRKSIEAEGGEAVEYPSPVEAVAASTPEAAETEPRRASPGGRRRPWKRSSSGST